MTRYRNIAIICAVVIAALCCWVILAEAATTTVTARLLEIGDNLALTASVQHEVCGV